MYDVTKLVSEKIFRELSNLLPSPRQKRLGRKRCPQEALLNGVLQVLVNGVAWGKIAECGCSYVSCFRYFQELQRRGDLQLIYTRIAIKKTDITEGAIDTTTITSFDFSKMTGWDGKNHKVGTKVSLFTDKIGLPADVSFGEGSDNDRVFLPTHLRKTFGRRKKILNLDMLYMGLRFRREMRAKGIKVNMETREKDYCHKRGPRFRLDEEKYRVRFLVERTNGWLKAFRRLRLRREYLPAMFKAFVFLALILILVRS